MEDSTGRTEAHAEGQAALLKNLLSIGVDLSATRDRRDLLEKILTEARRLCRAQAGSLFVRRGNRLEFVVAQNDAVGDIVAALPRLAVDVDNDSLTGFVAFTGQVVNVPDAHSLPGDAPFRIDRAFDKATGYRTRSILAIPLKCPNGEVVGVLQLINRLDESGRVVPFPDQEAPAIMSLASMAAVSIHNLLLTEQLKQAHLDTIIRLSVAGEFRDNDTAHHIRRISRLTALIARALGQKDSQVELIEAASAMHDIGKIGIPDSILLKPGPLTEEERRIVETHTLIGAEILAEPTNEMMSMARDIALWHHERWDGAGYPHCLKGERIPLCARITCLADVFDALATKRCYKEAYPIEKVVDIIRAETGRHFDPDVTRAFFRVFAEAVQPYTCAWAESPHEPEPVPAAVPG